VIAAIADKDVVHVIKWTGRVRLHAGVVTYCGMTADASNGVLQVPEAVFDRGASFNLDGETKKACGKCRMAAQAAIG
jgi:hypothetical protein